MSLPIILFTQYYMLNITAYGMKYPLGQLEPALLAMSPFYCAPQAPHWWGNVGGKRGLDSMQAFLSSNKTPVCYHYCFSTNPNHSLTLATKKNINSIPDKSSLRWANSIDLSGFKYCWLQKSFVFQFLCRHACLHFPQQKSVAFYQTNISLVLSKLHQHYNCRDDGVPLSAFD